MKYMQQGNNRYPNNMSNQSIRGYSNIHNANHMYNNTVCTCNDTVYDRSSCNDNSSSCDSNNISSCSVNQGMKEVTCDYTLNGFPIAMAYIPCQSYDDLYPCDTAICKGTLFKKLNLEFCGSMIS